MKRLLLQRDFRARSLRRTPAVCLLSTAVTVSVGIAQTATDTSSAVLASGANSQTSVTSTDPVTRAREIASAAPDSEMQDLRKAEIKELSVVMSGIELILRRNIEKVLDLWSFHEKDIPSVSRMRFMYRQAPEQIEAALRPYGYYQPTMEASLHDIGTKWQAVFRIKPGERVRVRNVEFKITGQGVDDPEFQQIIALAEQNLNEGQFLDQQFYDVLKRNIQSTAANLGYFDSEFQANEILVDLEDYGADVTLHFHTGGRYRIGEIILKQDREWLSDSLLAKYVELKENDLYNANEIQSVQSDLANTDYYATVDVRASPDDAVNRVIPVDVNLIHRNPKQYIYGAGYGTDTGARARLGITRRRLNNSGHRYLAETFVSEIGYGAGITYTIPTRDPRTDSYGFNIDFEEEDSDERSFRNFGFGGNYRYRNKLWFTTYALDYIVEEDTREDTFSRLLIPSVEWTRTSPFPLEERINVSNGNWFQVILRGGSSSFLSDTSFLQAQVSAKLVKTFGNGNRFITRGSIGGTKVDDFSQFPQTLRFYTGGDRTVRGYGYNRVSPLDGEGEEVGGRNLAEFSLEYEVPFAPQYSWAVFTDIGDAYDDALDWRQGFGLGFRWRSPIGPVRIDAARGFDNPSNGNWHLHLGVGPEF